MPVEFKDYYRTLGVSRTASDDEIRKAFRRLARQYHPDVAKNKAVAEEKFKEINEAYEVLGDPGKRRKYDALGTNWNRAGGFAPPPGWRAADAAGSHGPGEHFEFRFGGTGFSDFFEQFFGSRGSRFDGFPDSTEETAGPREDRFRSGRSFAQRGEDIEGDILVTLDEVLQGSVRTVSLQRTDPQDEENQTRTFRVKIPPGVQEGQLIRVSGQGGMGPAGGKAGDLYLRIKFARHPDFRVRGGDLYYELELAPWEAVLGANISMPTLEGSVALKIRPGTIAGQQLRLRGKGLPTKEGKRGDLFALVSIQVPTETNADDKALWEQLARKSGFNPRKHS